MEASYIPLTNDALDDLKEYIKRCVSHAEYRSGNNVWTKIPIGALLFLFYSIMTRRIRSRGSGSTTETVLYGLAVMKA